MWMSLIFSRFLKFGQNVALPQNHCLSEISHAYEDNIIRQQFVCSGQMSGLSNTMLWSHAPKLKQATYQFTFQCHEIRELFGNRDKRKR
jgi:hypothetical protein